MERIDTHCHVVPECWRQYCNELGHDKPDGMPAIPARILLDLYIPASLMYPRLSIRTNYHVRSGLLNLT